MLKFLYGLLLKDYSSQVISKSDVILKTGMAVILLSGTEAVSIFSLIAQLPGR